MSALEVWVTIAGGIVVVGGGLATIGRFLWRVLARTTRFLDDWFGHDGGLGIPARVGAIERRLGQVEHELRPNSGASLRDAVDRVEQAVSQPPAP